MSSELQRYLIVPFPDVAGVVDPWRERALGSSDRRTACPRT